MSTNNTALNVYTKAEHRFNAGKATKTDEVLLALWDEVMEQASTIRSMAIHISSLEMRHGEKVASIGEYTALLQRMALPSKTPLI